MLDYVRSTPEIRDVLVSGGDIANVPIVRLEEFVSELLDIPHVRDLRLASKSLAALPQHFLQSDVLEGLGGSRRRRDRAASASPCTRTRTTPPDHAARRPRRECPARPRVPRRPQPGRAARGVNATRTTSSTCARVADRASITPYYAYLCDMVPNAEHWRTTLWEAQEIQSGIMGYLPGYATPRLVCDVPLLGKMWVHQVAEYDRERGISRWRANDWASGDSDGFAEYYDPIHSLPEAGQAWWRANAD